MSNTACFCSGLIFFLIQTNLRLPVKSLINRASSRSGKIETSARATRVGSIMFCGWA